MRKIFDRKRIAMATMLAVAVLLLLGACSGTSNRFVIDARFLNMNQANFYVYSPDGAIEGIDTIEVNGGRFTYEHEIVQEGTVVIVFPNFATMPVFVEPGADISIDANAAHLKSMKITGTDTNEMFTEWRQNTENLSPPEMKKQAELFIKDHPESPAARWVLRRFFLEVEQPDIRKAQALLKLMLKASENNIQVAKLSTAVNGIGDLCIGDRLPRFTAKDIDGNPVTNGALLKGKTVICVWATWNFESLNAARQLATNRRYAADSLKVDNVVTICLDPSLSQCRKSVKDNTLDNVTTICDTLMWDSPLLKTLGLTNVPDNIKLKDGKVIGRRLPAGELTRF